MQRQQFIVLQIPPCQKTTPLRTDKGIVSQEGPKELSTISGSSH